MLKVAKIFIIIGMVLLCWLIIPVIVGILALQTINKAKSRKDLTSMGIITLLFCSLVGGILMLCVNDDEFIPTVETQKPEFEEEFSSK
ncbi:hypothetical protein ACJA27_00935 [Mycoplasmopsis lipophila]|uniref:hypothetical protein n=1 Tax=Mycoplasmopsis lipophila TaxID=2117 RepID=UPI00387358F7